jgi:hypothetical protein
LRPGLPDDFFHTKNVNFGAYFVAILVYFMVIGIFVAVLVYFYTLWFVVSRKIWQTLIATGASWWWWWWWGGGA